MNGVSPAGRDGCTGLAAVTFGSQIRSYRYTSLGALQVELHCNGCSLWHTLGGERSLTAL